ncbi:MAG: pilus assembly protein PilM, partial [Candidatus Omnitrophica bacterium]|nr:pilus assembly protein PilM [Candidatus Omnitrophota bacterium]
MKNIVAIDIGACLTKIIVAEDKRKLLEIASFKYFPTPYRKDDVFDEEVFFERLFAVISQEVLKSSQVAIGLPSPTTNFSFFELPSMGAADLKKAIISEAQRTIRPTPADSDILRYAVLKSPQAKEVKHANILVGSGVSAEITRYYTLFERQGITPSFIGSSASSPMVYPLGYYPDLPSGWCFVDIGYTNTTIVIFFNNIPTLVRTILFATRDFIRAISTDKKIGLKEAQDVFLKREAQELADTNWEYLISEIRRSFAYYKEVSGGKAIEGVHFTGGIFAVGPYIDILKKNIGGKVELFDARIVKKISLDKVAAEEITSAGYFFANSLGLALSLCEKKQTLNFLPETALKEKQTEIVKSLSRQVLTVLTLGLAVIFCLSLFWISAVRGKLKNELLTFSEQEYQDAVATENEITQIENQVTAEADFIAEQVRLGEQRRKVFSVIAKCLPSNAYVVTFEFGSGSPAAAPSSSGGRRGQPASPASEGETVKCEGRIQGTYEDTVEQLKVLARKLRKSDMFSEVTVSRQTLGSEPFLPYLSDFTENVRRQFT